MSQRLLSILITFGLFAFTAAWVPLLDLTRRLLRKGATAAVVLPEAREEDTSWLQPAKDFLPEATE